MPMIVTPVRYALLLSPLLLALRERQRPVFNCFAGVTLASNDRVLNSAVDTQESHKRVVSSAQLLVAVIITP